jgi:serine phosphatase RsbU (regulator of sigma subunit)/CheY-like chemotaxis protein
MHVLVGWNNETEADLLALYLNLEENQVFITTNPEELVRRARADAWDVILLSLSLPDSAGAFAVFQELRKAHAECPIVGVCEMHEVFRIARFLTNGLRAYIPRDPNGDYMFLVRSALESAVETVRAEREQKIAARLREEIESVRKLQESIIPRDLVTPPGYGVAARYEPSQIQVMGGRPVIMAGGDYYDAFTLGDDSVVLLVGDASGHGMKACMSIITMHTLVRMIRNNQYADTAAFVAEVNRRLCEQSIIKDDGGFITLLYGILRAGSHEFQWTSAGHPIPLLHRRGGGTVEAIGRRRDTGLPLGVLAETDYESFSCTIPPDSRLLLYTDGLIEAHPEERGEETCFREFGIEGVNETLRRTAGLKLTESLKALFDDSFAFTGGAGRHDDTSVVLLERE